MILSTFHDLTEDADAWRYVMPVGSMTAEAAHPEMVRQEQAQARPPTFQTEDRTGGFKLVLERIWRTGGNFGLPKGPSQASPRLRRRIGLAPAPIQAERSIGPAGMPAGLVPTRPAYESFLTAGSDSYVGS